MTLNKQPALDAIEKEQNTILHVADEIWDYAELSLQEFRSAKLKALQHLAQQDVRLRLGDAVGVFVLRAGAAVADGILGAKKILALFR